MRVFLITAFFIACFWFIPAKAIEVVATIKPLHSLVAGVMGKAGKPTLLLNGATSPHSYSLRPSDMRKLEDADVVFYISPELEIFLQRAIKNLPKETTVAALVKTEGLETLEVEEEHDAHHHAGTDPHIWMNPQNAILMVSKISDILAQADPQNSFMYKENAENLAKKLLDIDNELREKTAELKNLPYIVFHDGYRYFEKHYGLINSGVVTIAPDKQPSAKKLRELREEITKGNIICLFSEPQHPSSLLKTITEGTNINTAELDPLGADLIAGEEMYFALMNKFADNLEKCLKKRPLL